MTATETKYAVQSELMSAMQLAFTDLEAGDAWDAMDAQFRRVEKLLGYDPGSWHRGG